MKTSLCLSIFSRTRRATLACILFTMLLIAADGLQATTYLFYDLGVLPGDSVSEATSINNSGVIVGHSINPSSSNYSSRAFSATVTNGTVSMTNLGFLPGGISSDAYAINDSGVIVGNSNANPVNGSRYQHAISATVTNGTVKMTDLGFLPGSNHSNASTINNSDTICGWSNIGNYSHAFITTGPLSSGTDLGGFFDQTTDSYAFSVNISGSIVGNYRPYQDFFRAFHIANGKMTDLGFLPNCKQNNALAINSSGVIVGNCGYPVTQGLITNYVSEAYSATIANGKVTMIDLGTLGGKSMDGRSSEPYGINDSGVIVGASALDSTNNVFHAFVYFAGVMGDLNSLVDSSTPLNGFTLRSANAINNNGDIVGNGLTSNGASHAFLLKARNQPLIFIPGIAGSVLTSNGTQLWPSILRSNIYKLNLRSGQAPNIQAVDILRSYHGAIYQGFVDHVTGVLKYQEFPINADRTRITGNWMLGQRFGTPTNPTPLFFPYPYDWRRSIDTNTVDLKAYITTIRQLYGGAKVNIVTHSMGSLLLRRYILDNGTADIDKVITIAGPYLGTPEPIYQMLTGVFFGSFIADIGVTKAMKQMMATAIGGHQLLPSDTYLNNGGSPVFSEFKWDFNGNGTPTETYSSAQYKAMINQQTALVEVPFTNAPDVPSSNNDTFHSYSTSHGNQDNWSTSDGNIKYLHIYGSQNEDATSIAVTAKGNAILSNELQKVLGPGDGTVALLSSRRFSSMLAPGTITKVVSGPNTTVVHATLPGNADVLTLMDQFLIGTPMTSDFIPRARVPYKLPAATANDQQITITGTSYVQIVDSSGNQNTPYGDIFWTKVPGLDILYNIDDSYMTINGDGLTGLTLTGTGASQPVAFNITQVSGAYATYQFNPGNQAWKATIPNITVGTPPNVTVDTSGNGTFTTTIPASGSAGWNTGTSGGGNNGGGGGGGGGVVVTPVLTPWDAVGFTQAAYGNFDATYWPWINSGSFSWAYVYDQPSNGGFWLYLWESEATWVWTSGGYGGWAYAYGLPDEDWIYCGNYGSQRWIYSYRNGNWFADY